MAGHDLPAGWKLGTLEDVLEICDSGIWGQPGSSQDFPVLRSTNIHNGTMVLQEVAFRKVIRNPERYVMKNGDILVTKSSGSRDLIGKCCMFTDPNDGKRYLFSNFTQRLRVNEKMLPEYLFYFLVSDWGKRNLARLHETTSGLRNLDMKRYVKQELPVPPIEAQKRIVQLLKSADALRHRREKAHQLTSKIIQSVFLKMFGDPATNPMRWQMATIGDLVTEMQYGLSKGLSDNQKHVPIIRMNNITSDGHLDLTEMRYVDLPKDEAEKYRLHSRDILFNRTNSRELVGKTGLVTNEQGLVFASYLIRIITNAKLSTPEYLWSFLNSNHGKRILLRKARGAVGQANINTQELRSVEIASPPIDLQERFAKVLHHLEPLKAKQQQSTFEINQLFQSVMRKAFSGELPRKVRAIASFV